MEHSLEYFLVHPGGPFFTKKDTGYWTIPKGEPIGDEKLLETAKREFLEETGLVAIPPFFELGTVKQKSGKVVHAWAFEGSLPNDYKLISNTFSIEWPPKSGKQQQFPEIDKAKFFDDQEARLKINAAQFEFIIKLKDLLA
ncbi:MAG TPA: NUDIX domain-containing protein [Cytophagaceae bacterium]|jgi:predicted NUDIX family NTP pyrophosphohydrolase